MGLDIPVDRSFQSYQISATLKADIPVAIRDIKNLEGTMLPVNYQSWQLAFRATLHLEGTVILKADVPFKFLELPQNLTK